MTTRTTAKPDLEAAAAAPARRLDRILNRPASLEHHASEAPCGAFDPEDEHAA